MKFIYRPLLSVLLLMALGNCKSTKDQLCLLTVDITVSRGNNDAFLIAEPSGGIEPYDYNWTSGGIEKEKLVTGNGKFDLDGPGTHTVIVTDARNCSAKASVKIDFPCYGLHTVKDSDSNAYIVVSIGNQCWTATNVNATSGIPQVTDSSTWVNTLSPAWCYYNNDPQNAVFGKLYNWYAVQSGQLCPAGWHVPTLNDWQTLENFLGDESAGKMKATTGWDSPNEGANNNSGFFAMPGGYRIWLDNRFAGKGQTAGFWTSTQASDSTAFSRTLTFDSAWPSSLPVKKRQGYSCRCVKD